jgi:hypothetical protein
MKKINNLSAGFVVMTVMGTVSVFAMDAMATSTMMKHDDKMMDNMATGTMMKDKMMDKMENKMMKKEMMSEMMAMKVTKRSSKEEVIQLQEMLISKGFLKVRAGTKLGYYGPLTVSAYSKYTAKMKMEGTDKMMGTGTDTMMKK